MIFKQILAIFGILLLGACASSDNSVGSTDSPALQSAKINTSLGTEYMNRGQYEIALEKLKKATRADPNYAPAHTVLAVLYEQIGEPKLAEGHYKRAVEITPDNGDVNNNYGAYLCQTGETGKAEKYFLKATSDPFYRTPEVALSNAGSCAMQSGNLDNAERYLRQSLEYDAEFADALLLMADLSLRKGESFRARAFLQRYEGVGPETIDSLSLGHRVETGLQNDAGAAKYLDQILLQFPNSNYAENFRGGR
jgi:type IV pilus assembly protein PilF